MDSSNLIMNILMITHKHKSASIPRSFAMARQLVLLGHHVTLMLISGKKRIGFTEYEWDGIHVIESPDLLWGRLRTGWDIWNSINRCLYLRKVTEHYDLIHCFETRPATIYPALYFSKKKHIPIITDWNDWWGRHGLIDVNRPYWYRFLGGWLETYFEEAFRAKAAGLTVIAKGLEQRAIELGVDPDNICYISGGASNDYLEQRDKKECRKLADLPLEGPILGFSQCRLISGFRDHSGFVGFGHPEIPRSQTDHYGTGQTKYLGPCRQVSFGRKCDRPWLSFPREIFDLPVQLGCVPAPHGRSSL